MCLITLHHDLRIVIMWRTFASFISQRQGLGIEGSILPATLFPVLKTHLSSLHTHYGLHDHRPDLLCRVSKKTKLYLSTLTLSSVFKLTRAFNGICRARVESASRTARSASRVALRCQASQDRSSRREVGP